MKRKRKLSKIAAIFMITAMLMQLLPAAVYADDPLTYIDGSGTYEYENNGDGTATITYFAPVAGVTEITVPDAVYGLDVTVIGDYVFYSKGLNSITIPARVEEIGEYSFAENNLTSLTIPHGVTSIGEGAFCSSVNGHLIQTSLPK